MFSSAAPMPEMIAPSTHKPSRFERCAGRRGRPARCTRPLTSLGRRAARARRAPRTKSRHMTDSVSNPEIARSAETFARRVQGSPFPGRVTSGRPGLHAALSWAADRGYMEFRTPPGTAARGSDLRKRRSMPGQADGRRKVDRVESAQHRRIEAAGCFEGRGGDLEEGDRVEHGACLHGTVRGGAANCAQRLRSSRDRRTPAEVSR